jgi:hypothetical protein
MAFHEKRNINRVLFISSPMSSLSTLQTHYFKCILMLSSVLHAYVWSRFPQSLSSVGKNCIYFSTCTWQQWLRERVWKLLYTYIASLVCSEIQFPSEAHRRAWLSPTGVSNMETVTGVTYRNVMTKTAIVMELILTWGRTDCTFAVDRFAVLILLLRPSVRQY